MGFLNSITNALGGAGGSAALGFLGGLFQPSQSDLQKQQMYGQAALAGANTLGQQRAEKTSNLMNAYAIGQQDPYRQMKFNAQGAMRQDLAAGQPVGYNFDTARPIAGVTRGGDIPRLGFNMGTTAQGMVGPEQQAEAKLIQQIMQRKISPEVPAEDLNALFPQYSAINGNPQGFRGGAGLGARVDEATKASYISQDQDRANQMKFITDLMAKEGKGDPWWKKLLGGLGAGMGALQDYQNAKNQGGGQDQGGTPWTNPFGEGGTGGEGASPGTVYGGTYPGIGEDYYNEWGIPETGNRSFPDMGSVPSYWTPENPGYTITEGQGGGGGGQDWQNFWDMMMNQYGISGSSY